MLRVPLEQKGVEMDWVGVEEHPPQKHFGREQWKPVLLLLKAIYGFLAKTKAQGFH